MIHLENISKSFGNLQVLKPVSLTFERGTTAVLIGPSGCGKSTLLRIMMGLIPSDTGQVKINDEVLKEENINRLRHQMGYVLQDGGLFPHLRCKDNVTLLANYLRSFSTQRELENRVNELSELVKLPKEALMRYPSEISGGQRQRVAIMRALLLDPPLLFLDEPMGALDPLVRYNLQQYLKDICTQFNKTVVLVTHDMGEAAFFGEDMLLMHDGKILQRGSASDFTDQPADPFVTKFIGSQRQLIVS